MCCGSLNRRAAVAAAAQPASATFPFSSYSISTTTTPSSPLSSSSSSSYCTFCSRCQPTPQAIQTQTQIPTQTHLAQPTKKKEDTLLLRTVPTTTTTTTEEEEEATAATFDSAAKPKHKKKLIFFYSQQRGLHVKLINNNFNKKINKSTRLSAVVETTTLTTTTRACATRCACECTRLCERWVVSWQRPQASLPALPAEPLQCPHPPRLVQRDSRRQPVAMAILAVAAAATTVTTTCHLKRIKYGTSPLSNWVIRPAADAALNATMSCTTDKWLHTWYRRWVNDCRCHSCVSIRPSCICIDSMRSTRSHISIAIPWPRPVCSWQPKWRSNPASWSMW